ncbi:MAG: GAF domain-containing protein [Ktedonobacteraceae bacterium]
MKQQRPEDEVKTLAQARETIARQAKELQELQQRLGREQFAQELRKLFISAKNTSIILAPFTRSHLLEMVVTTAAQVISARSSSLFLIDKEGQDLIFEVAIGPAAQEVKKIRVPLGHGIAGIVAMSGQPMAIANVPQDERFAVDIATSVNYIPETILCVPLFYDDRIIGAIELLDKIGADSFSLKDIETLGLFANIAAVAIAQSQAYHDEQTMLTLLVQAFADGNTTLWQSLNQDAAAFSNWLQTPDSINNTARELALLVHELIMSGEQESEMCKNILQSFTNNLHDRRKASMAGIQ